MSTTDPFAAIAAELYGLVPGEFTNARNGYAKQLRDDGDRELSDRVKSLRKPASAAWVVNLLVRHQGDQIAQLLDLGQALRQAQDDFDGDALRELNKQRRRLVAAVAGQGRELARDAGQKVSESVVRQVEETLHAAMIDSDAAAAVRSGVLVDPLSPSGVGSLKVATAVAEHTALGSSARPLAEVVGGSTAGRKTGGREGGGTKAGGTKAGGTKAGGTKAGLHAVPGPSEEELAERKREEQRRAREEAQAAVDEAAGDVDKAREELAAHEKSVQDLQAQCLQVNVEIDELKRRIDELEDRLEQLDDDADAARDERDQAAEQVAVAESALAEAKAALDALG